MRLRAFTIKPAAMAAWLDAGLLVPALIMQFLDFHGLTNAYRHAVLGDGSVRVEPIERNAAYTHRVTHVAGMLN